MRPSLLDCFALLCLSSMLGCVGTPGGATPPPPASLETRSSASADAMRRRGMLPLREERLLFAEAGSTREVRVALPAAGCYRFVAIAIAGAGVDAMTLALRNDSGVEIPGRTSEMHDGAATTGWCTTMGAQPLRASVQVARGQGEVLLAIWHAAPDMRADPAAPRGSLAHPIPLRLGESARGDTAAGDDLIDARCLHDRGLVCPSREIVYALSLDEDARISLELETDPARAGHLAAYILPADALGDTLLCTEPVRRYPPYNYPWNGIVAVAGSLPRGEYRVVVDGTACGTGEYALRVTQAPPHARTTACTSAEPLALDNERTGTLRADGDDFPSGCRAKPWRRSAGTASTPSTSTTLAGSRRRCR